MAVTKLVLVRHGESQWNKENRFTGWYDVDLSEKGVSEAKAAGKLLKEEGYSFDFAYTDIFAAFESSISVMFVALHGN